MCGTKAMSRAHICIPGYYIPGPARRSPQPVTIIRLPMYDSTQNVQCQPGEGPLWQIKQMLQSTKTSKATPILILSVDGPNYGNGFPSSSSYSGLPSGQAPISAMAPTSLAPCSLLPQVSWIKADMRCSPFSSAPLVQSLPSLAQRLSIQFVPGAIFRNVSSWKRGAVAVFPSNMPACNGADMPKQMVINAALSL